jgi:Tfp pilus assembly PilM family ATPase
MAGAFQNILNSFNFFKKSEDSVLGIDIGASTIKAVQLRRQKGKAVLETYGALSLGPYGGVEIGKATNLPPEKIADAITDLMREANITTKNCALSIPFRSSLVSIMEIPKVDDEKMKEMIPLEARKYLEKNKLGVIMISEY